GHHCIARADTRSRCTLNVNGRYAVITLKTWRTVGPFACGKCREWHHFTAIITHIPLVQIFRHHPRASFTLNIDFLDTTAINEVIDIRTAPSYTHGTVNFSNTHAQCTGLCMIDNDTVLWSIFLTIRTHTSQTRVLCC